MVDEVRTVYGSFDYAEVDVPADDGISITGNDLRSAMEALGQAPTGAKFAAELLLLLAKARMTGRREALAAVAQKFECTHGRGHLFSEIVREVWNRITPTDSQDTNNKERTR